MASACEHVVRGAQHVACWRVFEVKKEINMSPASLLLGRGEQGDLASNTITRGEFYIPSTCSMQPLVLVCTRWPVMSNTTPL